MDDLISDFIAETREGLEALDSGLVLFEQRPDDPATLGEIFRLIHTIKGTCGFLGLSRLQSVAHAAENVLGGFRDRTLPVSPIAVSAVLDTVDLIRSLTDALGATGAEPDGDDRALIARLEAVLCPEPEISEVSAAAEPMDAGPDLRKLIDRLGGDSTLDMAVEMAIPRLQQHAVLGPLLAAADPYGLHVAVRDGLTALARSERRSDAFVGALNDHTASPPNPEAMADLFDLVGGMLSELEVGASAVDALRSLALPKRSNAKQRSPASTAAPAQRPDPTPPPPLAVAGAPRQDTPAPVFESVEPPQTIRVSVDALEHLMTVASELVLIRNQLIQTLRLDPESPFAAPLNRLNQVTTELQEGVMTTRMQPISGAWAKLPRLVRDLAQDLGKTIDLVTFGQETELDRQVMELIKDPLTHMVRNAADHGLETPAERRAAGKPEAGRITLQARHEGGAIVIEVADDGRGLSADKIRAKAAAGGLIPPSQVEQMSDAEIRQLIFLPGLSTASEVTAVSGRGVGMDVVRTNIEKIGGVIEVASAEGAGCRFTIRIPLTLTIVSALIVESCGDRFAMPQSSIVELVSASGGSGRSVEYINGAAVLRLRDRLLPLVSLQNLLKLEPLGSPASETCIVVARVGSFTFGVIVDRVFDTEEIVVKPVASVLRQIKIYSGATILGDGAVIQILDLKGVSIETGAGQALGAHEELVEAEAPAVETSSILVFRSANGLLKATPLSSVSRIEEVAGGEIELVDGRMVLQYRGKLMPIIEADTGPAPPWKGEGQRPLLVFARGEQTIGLLASEIIDIVESSVAADMELAGPGVLGAVIIAGAATELIDVDFYWRKALNETLTKPAPTPAASVKSGHGAPAQMTLGGAILAFEERAPKPRLLLVDQSPFSELLLQPLLLKAGYDVCVSADPDAALALYDNGAAFDLIMTDVSCPKAAGRFASAFRRATEWHSTPLMGLALATGGRSADASFDQDGLLASVSGRLAELKGAA